MAAKGSVAKQEIFEKILESFEGSFFYNNGKEIRIPWTEDGNEVQIKVTLTCAKEIVDAEGASVPASPTVKKSTTPGVNAEKATPAATLIEPTQEEKENVESLLVALGLQ